MSINIKISEIKCALVDYLKHDIPDTVFNEGLLSGNSGVSLFFYLNYLNEGKAEDQEMIEELIVRRFDTIQDILSNPHYCTGIAGFNWLLRYYEKQGALEITETVAEYIDELDKYVVEAYELALKVSNFDFLHGATGLLHYLLMTNKSSLFAEDFVNRLDETKEEIPGKGIAWKSTIKKTDGFERVYNFGLAHGMPAILLMLAQLIQKKVLVNDAKAKELLAGCVSFILSEKLEEGADSTFSNWSSPETKPVASRLAWCYGDLGVCIALWKAGEALGDTAIQQEAIASCLKTTERVTQADTGLLDTGICHGTAGVSLIYQRMYRFTGIEKFKSASNYWIDETIRMGDFLDGMAGFKMWTREGYINEANVLEGIAGIGLVLLSHDAQLNEEWYDILLIA